MQNRIRNLREDHDYTQQQVADALGITQRKYSYLETGTQQWTDEFWFYNKCWGQADEPGPKAIVKG